jgi:hypothetical protein
VLGSLAASQQLTVDPGSKPPGWLLLGSKLSGVLPVGTSHRYMVMVKLPSALGTTEVVPPTLNFDSVRPSHSDCEVGSRSHSSVSTEVPALKVVFAATVIVSTAASPLYCPDGNEGFGSEKMAVVCGVRDRNTDTPVVCWANASPAAAAPVAPRKHNRAAKRAKRDNFMWARILTGNFRWGTARLLALRAAYGRRDQCSLTNMAVQQAVGDALVNKSQTVD